VAATLRRRLTAADAGRLSGLCSDEPDCVRQRLGAQPLNHEAGQLTLDRGRILLAGARLRAQNLPDGVKDSDYGVARLK
jgi:hypothetical protein